MPTQLVVPLILGRNCDLEAGETQYESAFALSMFDHSQLDAVVGSRLIRDLACGALIQVSQLDVLLPDLLYPPDQVADLARSCSSAGVACKANRWPSVFTDA
jgi:hypothetical protein